METYSYNINKARSRQNHYIYLVFDKEREKYYCGKRSTDNEIESDFYYGSGLIIERIIKKLSKEQIQARFDKKILHISKDYDENLKQEIYWVNDVFDAPNNPNFYNISDGGYGGNLIAGFSDEEKQEVYKKRGLGNIGKKVSENQKRVVSQKLKGKKKSVETKDKMKLAAQNRKPRPHTIESKLKLSKAMSNEGNPRARKCLILSSNGDILFRGIRKKMEQFCKDNGICCAAIAKRRLYDGQPFNPQFKTRFYPNAFNYVGILFKYDIE
ncbi:MAG: hypothetical protein Q7R95_10675 [bacterium]|nr:hypothetical protein [bacterium]